MLISTEDLTVGEDDLFFLLFAVFWQIYVPQEWFSQQTQFSLLQ